MEYYYSTSSGQMSLCYIIEIDNYVDRVTIYAKEHPKNPGLSLTNSIEFLISDFEKLYNKEVRARYIDSDGNPTSVKMENGKPIFEMKL